LQRKVIINWQVSSYFGWGVYGLNLALAWAGDPDVALLSPWSVLPSELAVDALRLRTLEPFLRDSANLHAQLAKWRGQVTTAQGPMLSATDASFRTVPVGDVRLKGQPTIAVTFFETAVLSEDALEAAAAYPLIVTGSTWNERVLRAHGLTNVTTVLQGVDPSLFHPAPRGAFARDRFLVFSGGKLERRKGQDIALLAFRRFAERHPDALLVAAWHSPWPKIARTIDASGLAEPVVFGADGKLDATAWALANGVRAENFLDAGRTPNPLMPQLYRQMDVALFPNRCEGGTNLVAMECMACGVPAILSANTGHLDLIGEDNCYVLERQGAVPGEPLAADHPEVKGWGESDVDEAVELLERAYVDRADAGARGERGAATLSRMTWSATARRMKQIVLDACG
jgi:glycosyltransferase involved in cell wall biosynthesis